MENTLYISKYLSGTSTEDENKYLLDWVQANEENKIFFQEQCQIWHIASGLKKNTFDWQKALNTFKEKHVNTQETKIVSMNSVQNSSVKNNILKTSINLKTLASVAAIVVFILGGFWVLQLQKEIKHITNSTTKPSDLYLTDGTFVTLNVGSGINYPVSFKEKFRIVELQGDAFFEVTYNPDKPFIIKTLYGNVKVVGTSFYVDCDSIKKSLTVIVKSGKVKVINQESTKSVDITAGMRATIENGQFAPNKLVNNDVNYLSWKTGMLMFKNTDLHKVVSDIERYYDIDIIFNDSLIEKCKLTAKFERQPLESVLKMLELTFGFSIEKQNNQYIIKGSGC